MVADKGMTFLGRDGILFTINYSYDFRLPLILKLSKKRPGEKGTGPTRIVHRYEE